MSLFKRLDGYDILMSLLNMFLLFNFSLKYLHIIDIKMGRICAMELGLICPLNYSIIQRRLTLNIVSFVYLCGIEFESYYKSFFTKDSFVVFQGFFYTMNL